MTTTSLASQLASVLKVAASAIKKVERWAKVWFVVVAGKGARFVSLKAATKPPATREVVAQMKKLLEMKARLKKSQTAKWVLNEVYRLASMKDRVLPYAFSQIAYGISYAIQTARIDGEMAICLERKFDASLMVNLIAAMATSGIEVSGDVPAWLNKNRDVIVF